MKKALESLHNKFKSGNSVPVSQAIVTRAEYEAVKAELDACKAQAIELVLEQGFEFSYESSPFDNDWAININDIKEYAAKIGGGEVKKVIEVLAASSSTCNTAKDYSAKFGGVE